MKIQLQKMTKEMMHELFREFTADPDIFTDMSLFKEFVYDIDKVNALYDSRQKGNRITFAVMLDGKVIGELGLKHISEETKACELSIHLQNDSVKNRGYGTAAEKLGIEYAFNELGMETVFADSVYKNTRSQHVLEKVGFRYLYDKDGFKYYRLDKKDWEKRVC